MIRILTSGGWSRHPAIGTSFSFADLSMNGRAKLDEFLSVVCHFEGFKTSKLKLELQACAIAQNCGMSSAFRLSRLETFKMATLPFYRRILFLKKAV
jgi:hypothetical protein